MKYFTMIGNHDAIDSSQEGFGAALTIFFHYKDEIDGVYIFTSPDNPHFPYKQTAEKTMRRMQQEKKDLSVHIIEMELNNPVNFDLVYKVMLDESLKVLENDKIQDDEKIINITSGTPTMTTCWVLLQKSGLIPNAKLIQSFELQFQREYGKSCQEVNLAIDDFPEINTPAKEKRELNRVHEELKVLRDEITTTEIDNSIPGFIGKSKTIREIKDQIIHLVDKETHVLILGERGTGKEVVARAIWDTHRKDIDKKLIPFDCGLFETNLIISELFGYEKGAFTGANQTKHGIVEISNGRMLYLDEIGNIPINNQNVFMRFLQFGEWRRVGSTEINTSSIQVVATTNKNIHDDRVFKSDLRDRFHEIIELPTLRERKSDIKLLTNHFLTRENKNVSFHNNVYEQLEIYPWPGNVRQLEHWVKRICRKYKDIQISWEEIPELLLPDGFKDSTEFDFPDLPIDSNNFITELRLHALDIADGNKAEADRLLGLKEGTIKQWTHQRKQRER
jgi:DNA-binding NtrC family response regulator